MASVDRWFRRLRKLADITPIAIVYNANRHPSESNRAWQVWELRDNRLKWLISEGSSGQEACRKALRRLRADRIRDESIYYKPVIEGD